MRMFSRIGCFGVFALVSSCSGDGVAPQPGVQFASVEQAITHQEHSHQGCADHADDPALETAAVRTHAAQPLRWHGKRPGRRGTTTVRLLGFNDFHGQLAEGRFVSGRPVGGAAVLASYLRAAQTGFEGKSLVIHAGDFVGASPPDSALLQDEPSIQFLNTLANRKCKGQRHSTDECNVIGTLGNHEFDEGKDELLRLLNGGNHAAGPFLQDPYRGALFPYVSANVVTTNAHGKQKPFITPYVVRKVGGVEVGVIGAVLQQTPTIVTPAGVAGLTFLDEVTAINKHVAELKRKRVHTIVVTIHQGAPQSPSYATDTDPAATVGAPISTIVSQLSDEVDVVISGHSHSFTNALIKNASGHEILVTQAFSASTAYGEIDLTIDRDCGEVVAKSARVVTTYSDQAPGNVRDPAVQAIVSEAAALTAPLVNRPIATFAADITRTQTTAGESTLGNLIADAQRAAMGTDFAFMNPGGIRADLVYAANPSLSADAAGLALWGELFTIQPFGNSLVKLSMTGQQILDLLNQQFVVNRFLQISGLNYTWDNALPVGSKVVSAQQNGAAIDPTAVYTVTANNFIATGGDGFTTFLLGTGNVGGPIDLDAFITYVEGLAQPFAAPALGRITRLN